MSAPPFDHPYQQGAYTRMWEEVDNDWSFDPVDDWDVWDEEPDPGTNADDIYDYALERSTPDSQRTRAGRGGPQQSHDAAARRSETSVAYMSNSDSNSRAHLQPSRSQRYEADITGAPRQRRRPIPDHSENWLDPTATLTRPFDHLAPEDYFEPLPDTPSSSPTASLQSAPYNPDSSQEETDNEMPTRRRAGGSIVDLTNERSSPATNPTTSRRQPRSLKRAAEDEAGSSSSSRTVKRSRVTTSSHPMQHTVDVEELDLTAENPSAEEELLQQQQQAAIAAQQEDFASGPLKIGKRQCIICMEAYTNATVTHCGHIYCHECLWQALRAVEKGPDGAATGKCPVCRKPVKRVGKDGRAGQMVAVSFLTKKGFQRGLGRREGRAVLG